MSLAPRYLAVVISVFTFGAHAQANDHGLAVAGGPTFVVAQEGSQRVLTGEEIRAKFVGNTITGTDSGEAFAEYLAPNGVISGETPSGRYRGFWRIDGDRMCFRYQKDEGVAAAALKWDCNPVTINGPYIYWTDEVDDGDPVDATLLTGNPKNL